MDGRILLMAYDKVVDSTFLDGGLTLIADAIREKNGSADELLFPDDFVTAIAAIEGGGGSEDLDGYIFKSGVGAIVPLFTDIESGAKCTIGTDSIKLTVSNYDSGYSLIETENPISLTGKNIIIAVMKNVNFDRSVTGFYISRSKSADFDSVTAAAKTSIKDISNYGVLSISVASYSGSYYVGFNGAWAGEIIEWYVV